MEGYIILILTATLFCGGYHISEKAINTLIKIKERKGI
tara:strand:+ start:699 stop:812 length:114 start_codon:yes stop_codon:yes gene_type:complete